MHFSFLLSLITSSSAQRTTSSAARSAATATSAANSKASSPIFISSTLYQDSSCMIPVPDVKITAQSGVCFDVDEQLSKVSNSVIKNLMQSTSDKSYMVECDNTGKITTRAYALSNCGGRVTRQTLSMNNTCSQGSIDRCVTSGVVGITTSPSSIVNTTPSSGIGSTASSSSELGPDYYVQFTDFDSATCSGSARNFTTLKGGQCINAVDVGIENTQVSFMATCDNNGAYSVNVFPAEDCQMVGAPLYSNIKNNSCVRGSIGRCVSKGTVGFKTNSASSNFGGFLFGALTFLLLLL